MLTNAVASESYAELAELKKRFEEEAGARAEAFRNVADAQDRTNESVEELQRQVAHVSEEVERMEDALVQRIDTLESKVLEGLKLHAAGADAEGGSASLAAQIQDAVGQEVREIGVVLGNQAKEDRAAILDALMNEVVPQIVDGIKSENHVHGVSEAALQAALRVTANDVKAQFDELFIEGRANTAKIMEGVLGSEDRLAAQMSAMMAKVEEVYKAMEMDKKGKNSSKKATSLDLDRLTVVKGKKGKLGRGVHGVVRLANYQLKNGKSVKVAIKQVPVDDHDAQVALQVRY